VVAVEAKAVSNREEVLALLKDAEAWRRPLVQQFLLERIGRRYLAENSDAGLRACAWLLDHAPAPPRSICSSGHGPGARRSALAQVPAALEKQIDNSAASGRTT